MKQLLTSLVTCLGIIVSDASADLFINEIDYDNSGGDSAEWVELAGTVGLSLDAYEIALINQAGSEYGTVDLAPASFTFTDETGSGWGFFVLGIVGSDYSPVLADYAPSGWNTDEIQNGGTDSIQLRLKAGSANIHLIDYEGNNTNTTEDQIATDGDSSSSESSLYLTGTGSTFSDFTFSNAVGNGTPGALNVGQTLSAVPEPSAFLFGGLICSVLGVNCARKRMKVAAA